MKKETLRKEMINYLEKITDEKRAEVENSLLNNLLKEDYWKDANTIGITVSQHIEWNTEPIIRTAWEQGKNVVVPKCLPKTKEMQFYLITSYDQLKVAHFDIKEPVPELTKSVPPIDIDLLVVPGLIFDRKGYRVGFGGGYYDRFLVDFNQATVSLLSSRQLVEEVPTEEYDLPVQHIITENESVYTREDV